MQWFDPIWVFPQLEKRESKFVATDTTTTQTTKTSSLFTLFHKIQIHSCKRKSPPSSLFLILFIQPELPATAEISCQFLACFLAHSADKYSLDWRTLCISFVTKVNNWLQRMVSVFLDGIIVIAKACMTETLNVSSPSSRLMWVEASQDGDARTNLANSLRWIITVNISDQGALL